MRTRPSLVMCVVIIQFPILRCLNTNVSITRLEGQDIYTNVGQKTVKNIYFTVDPLPPLKEK